MRRLFLATMAIGAASIAGPAAAQTYAPGYPVCLHVYRPPITNAATIRWLSATPGRRAAGPSA